MRELTSTNRPFGLTIKFTLHMERTCSALSYPMLFGCETSISRSFKVWRMRSFAAYFETQPLRISSAGSDARITPQVSGDHTARETPVPIPNTEVKPCWADCTARESVWESRSLPD